MWFTFLPMFEDQQNQTPSRAPATGPKDMFAEFDQGPTNGQQVPAPAAVRPSALESGLIRPISKPSGTEPMGETTRSVSMDDAQAPGNEMFDDDSSVIKEPFMKKWKIIVLVLLVFILVAGGVYIFYRKITTGVKTGPAVQQPSVVAPPVTTPVEPPEEPTVPPTVEDDVLPPPPSVLPETPKDSDQDGLTDVEEVELGTDPLSTDSDKDGLTDKEEVLLWRTDPRNPDSDGDSFLDGEEVSNGYRPDGPGKLFE